ncbi:MAG: type II toxin-antitoxin system VapC family toxin [Halomonas sp.]|uniref:type II toxin-antitoxin system VapC family toxin n=1 Tax=Halomonas sp. TaxID=1486246 RepID=UPI002ACE4943|nr:type II toxin-antitoxin system VapC family toxin [Halomonas sp.]MDZ7852550.1 type II toxin-antitoxin system VapC family toxin [Halomonas sp.]
MSGNRYLLDTNYILGLLKSSPKVMDDISRRGILTNQGAYSVITRLELLGYPGITDQEHRLILEKLQRLSYLPLTRPIEEQTIRLRRTHRVKLPDAIIAATSMVHGLDLLTFDQKLTSILSVMTSP